LEQVEKALQVDVKMTIVGACTRTPTAATRMERKKTLGITKDCARSDVGENTQHTACITTMDNTESSYQRSKENSK